MAWSSAGQSNAPSSSSSGSKSSSSGSKSSSDKSSGGWGSASYAANNSSQMSGGYRSDGGSSSGSGWGGKSTANPSVTSQYGGSSSSSSSGSSSGSSSLADSKRHAESLGTNIKGRDTNSGAPANLAGADGVLASAPTMDAWSRNTAYTDGKAGEFGSDAHFATLDKAAKSKTMTEGQIATARAMIAGEQANTGQRVMGGLLNTLGTAVGGLPGSAVAKVASMGVNKLTDNLSGYADNAAYQQSKALAAKDESLIGKALGFVAPKGVGSMVSAAYDNTTGDYSTRIGGLRNNMQKAGYMDTTTRNVQMNGSNNANGLLNTMFAQRQVTQPDTENSIAALNYGNFTPSYGSVI